MSSSNTVKTGTTSVPSKFSQRCLTYCGDLFTPKCIDELREDSKEGSMKRSLTCIDLTLFGIGSIVGSGIFVLTGQAAGNNAGPAIVISFLIAGLCSGLAAMCYSEMASMIPVAGSAYTYSYATMGELLAWTIGWDLILEYLVSAAAVSVGWSGYATSFIRAFGGHQLVQDEWTSAPFAWNETGNYFYLTGNIINIPAILIVLVLTVIAVIGVKESSTFNGITVFIKITVILIFIFSSIKWIQPDNWTPFVPPTQSWGKYGVSGILQATTMVFYSYIGFDGLCTTAQECRNAQRDLPIGIIGSLIICTVLYVAVSLCLTGLVPYTQLIGVASPISLASDHIGQHWLSIITEIGAIAGLTSVILGILIAQPRVFFSMARDGLLPTWAARTHPRFGTPVVTTVITGVCTATLAALLPIEVLGELTSVGTLCAFFLVSVGVLLLRIRRPDLPRKFTVPLGPFLIPILSAACSIALVAWSTYATKIRLAVWMAVGFVLYFVYGKRHSKLQARLREERKEEMTWNVKEVESVDEEKTSPMQESEIFKRSNLGLVLDANMLRL